MTHDARVAAAADRVVNLRDGLVSDETELRAARPVALPFGATDRRMTVTLVKLAFAGIRSRLLASALTILLSSAAAATIVLALEVGGDRARSLAAHVRCGQRRPRDCDGALGGRRAHDRERSPASPNTRAGPEREHKRRASRGRTERLLLAGLRSAARVNVPVRTAGSEPREGGIVLERSFAEALGLQVGTHAPARRPRRSGRAAGGRHGDLPQPAALPARQPGPGLGHARHARADRA